MTMFGRMDRYVGRTVLGAWGAGMMFMVLLFILVDLLVELGDRIDQAEAKGVATWTLITRVAEFYVLLLPIIFVTLAPFVCVIAGMFAVSRLMSANEIVPMIFTGRSTFRVLRPVLLMGFCSSLLMGATWEFVIPSVVEPLHAARRAIGDDLGEQFEQVVLRVPENRQVLFVDEYDPGRSIMHDVTLVDQGTGPNDTVLLKAESAAWDPNSADWRLLNGARVTEDRSVPQAMLGLSQVTPELLLRMGKEGRESAELSYSELLDLQRLNPGRRDYELAFHSHITFALACLLLVILALPFAVHFERGTKIERVVFSVAVCAAYLVTDLTCQSLGRSLLHPVLAAWLPTILFGSFGVVFFSSIKT